MLIPPGISDGKTPQNRKRLSMISRTSYTSMKSQENIVLSVQGERAKLLLDNYILFEKARSRLKYLIFKSKNIEKEEIQDNLITAWESVVRSVKFLKSFKLKFSGKKIIGDIYLQVRNFQEAISQYTLVVSCIFICLEILCSKTPQIFLQTHNLSSNWILLPAH